MSLRPSFRSSLRPPIEVGTLWAQLLVQICTDSFETSLVFWSWSDDMHVVWVISSDYFLLLFLQVELSHFSGIIYNKVNGQGIPCWRNSSYSFIPILSKLHWCFGHGLKICMWFGCNPLIIFIKKKLSLKFITFPAFFTLSAINI